MPPKNKNTTEHFEGAAAAPPAFAEIIRFGEEGAAGMDIIYADPVNVTHETHNIDGIFSHQTVFRTIYRNARTYAGGNDRPCICIIDQYTEVPAHITLKSYDPPSFIPDTVRTFYYKPWVIMIRDVNLNMLVKVIVYNPNTKWYEPLYPRNGEYYEMTPMEDVANSCQIV